MNRVLVCVALGLCAVLSYSAAAQDNLQGVRAKLQAEKAAAEAADTKAADDSKKEEPKKQPKRPVNTTPVSTPGPKSSSDPQHEIFRLQLMDGSILTGQLSVTQFTVQTEFGPLLVPIGQVSNFVPGMNSRPGFRKRFETYVAQLGDDQFDNREKAEKGLIELGPAVIPELEKYLTDKDEERRNRVEKIMTQLESMAPDEDDISASDRAMIAEDTLATPKFKIIGKLQIEKFTLKSSYGTLQVKIGDIRHAQRISGDRIEVRKTISLGGANITPNNFKTTTIRVQRGDVIRFSASGQITLPPWGSRARSGPDGASNYGWYINNKVPVGALAARIGASGKVFKVGSSLTHTVTKAGTLQLAVGMHPSYSNGGYNFAGEYKVKIRIQPK